MHPPKSAWSGRFCTIDDLWTASNAQMRAAITMDRLADPDGWVRVSRSSIAKLARVAPPRVTEAAALLQRKGRMHEVDKHNTCPGYRFVNIEEKQ